MVDGIFKIGISLSSMAPLAAPDDKKGANNPALITWEPELLEEFNSDSNDWEKADWSNGNPFNNTWQPDNVAFENGLLSLNLDKKGCPEACDGKPYASAEYRTSQEYGYGYYEVRMKAAKGDGLNTSFFTYHADLDGSYRPIESTHHEIDFEILGKDTTKVQLNYYIEGQGGHEYMVDLGFDASKAFHNYGFKWSKNELIFYVDGKEVHRAQGHVPFLPSRIMVNLWPGVGVDGWLKPFKYPGHPIKAQYDWIKFSPLSPSPAPTLTPTPILTPRPTIEPKQKPPIKERKINFVAQERALIQEQIEKLEGELAPIGSSIGIDSGSSWKFREPELAAWLKLANLYLALGNYKKAEESLHAIIGYGGSLTNDRPVFFDEAIFLLADIRRIQAMVEYDPKYLDEAFSSLTKGLANLRKLEDGYKRRYYYEMIKVCAVYQEHFGRLPEGASPIDVQSYFNNAANTYNSDGIGHADNFIAVKTFIAYGNYSVAAGFLDEAKVSFGLVDKLAETIQSGKGDVFDDTVTSARRAAGADSLDIKNFYIFQAQAHKGLAETEKKLALQAKKNADIVSHLEQANNYYQSALDLAKKVRQIAPYDFYRGHMYEERQTYYDIMADYGENNLQLFYETDDIKHLDQAKVLAQEITGLYEKYDYPPEDIVHLKALFVAAQIAEEETPLLNKAENYCLTIIGYLDQLEEKQAPSPYLLYLKGKALIGLGKSIISQKNVNVDTPELLAQARKVLSEALSKTTGNTGSIKEYKRLIAESNLYEAMACAMLAETLEKEKSIAYQNRAQKCLNAIPEEYKYLYGQALVKMADMFLTNSSKEIEDKKFPEKAEQQFEALKKAEKILENQPKYGKYYQHHIGLLRGQLLALLAAHYQTHNANMANILVLPAYNYFVSIPKTAGRTYFEALIEKNSLILQYSEIIGEDNFDPEEVDSVIVYAKEKGEIDLLARALIVKAEHHIFMADSANTLNSRTENLLAAKELLEEAKENSLSGSYTHAKAVILHASILTRLPKTAVKEYELSQGKQALEDYQRNLNKGSYLWAMAQLGKGQILLELADRTKNTKLVQSYVREAYEESGRLNESNFEDVRSRADIIKAGAINRMSKAFNANEIKTTIKGLKSALSYYDVDSYFASLANFLLGELYLTLADKTKEDKYLSLALAYFNDVPDTFQDLHNQAELIRISLLLREPDSLTEFEISEAINSTQRLTAALYMDAYYFNLAKATEAELHIALADKLEKAGNPLEKTIINQELWAAENILRPGNTPEEYSFLRNKAVILYCALAARHKPIRDSLISKGEYSLLHQELVLAIKNLAKAGEKDGYLVAMAYATSAEMRIQIADMPKEELDICSEGIGEEPGREMELDARIGLLNSAFEDVKQALALSKKESFLYYKGTILKGAIYTRHAKLASSKDVTRSIGDITAIIADPKKEIGAYLKSYGRFVIGQLYLVLANREEHLKENLAAADYMFNSAEMEVDPYIKAASAVMRVEIAIRMAEYIKDPKPDMFNSRPLLNISMEKLDKIFDLLETAQSNICLLKDIDAITQLQAKVEMYRLSLELSQEKKREAITEGDFEAVQTVVNDLNDPIYTFFIFELKLKQLSFFLEQAMKAKEKKNKEGEANYYDRATALIQELNGLEVRINDFRKKIEWSDSFLKAEFYFLKSTYYAIQQSKTEQQLKEARGNSKEKADEIKILSDNYYKNKNQAALFAKKAYEICDKSKISYLHDTLPHYIAFNTGIQRNDALRVNEASDKKGFIMPSPTPTEIAVAGKYAARPIDSVINPPQATILAITAPVDEPDSFLKYNDAEQILGQSWKYYKQHFIRSDGMPLAPEIKEHGGKDTTNSEAVSYVLLRAAIMNDQATFDLVWGWAQKNLQRINIDQVYNESTKDWITLDTSKQDHLFAWQYTVLDAKKKIGGIYNGRDVDAASDADQDIAAALLIASKYFNNSAYKEEAQLILDDIWRKEVANIDGNLVMLAGPSQYGAQDPISEELTHGVNPSYFRFQYYESLFANADKDHPWSKLVAPSYNIIGLASAAEFHDEKGHAVSRKAPIIPDFISLTNDFEARDFGWKKGDNKQADYYSGGDAFRTFFWLAMQDRSFTRDYMADNFFKRSGQYEFYKKQLDNTQKENRHPLDNKGILYSGYNIDGSPHWKSETPQSLAGYLCFFVAAGDMESAGIIYKRLMNYYQEDKGYWKATDSYYANNWAWFAIAFMAGKFDKAFE